MFAHLKDEEVLFALKQLIARFGIKKDVSIAQYSLLLNKDDVQAFKR